jgi:type II secretory pathway pseudopilin PulG
MTNPGFTLRELISVIVLIVFLIALSVPLGDASARTSRLMQNSTQLRGVHQGLVTYANSNKNWYPGLDSKGQAIHLRTEFDPVSDPFKKSENYEEVTVEGRYWVLLDGDYFTPEYAISPFETASNIIEYPGTGPVVEQNYSFAMLQLPPNGTRLQEWKQTLNSKSVVMSDRNTGTATNTFGYHNDRWESSSAFGCSYNHRQPYLKIGHWVGNVLWNDNHVAFEPTDTLPTEYDGVANPADNLFRASGMDDALLIHAGN